MQLEIPNKSLFKMSEVCSLTNVKPYVLRYWESEFEEISPIVSDSGQKLYEHKDIKIILKIKKLLFNEKMTIQRAKLEMKKINSEFAQDSNNDTAKSSMINIKRSLSDKDLQKLILAKAKLKSLLNYSNSLLGN